MSMHILKINGHALTNESKGFIAIECKQFQFLKPYILSHKN